MRFFSRGKILISGEYVVLYGARALSVPTRLGQYLEVEEISGKGNISVRSWVNDRSWFSCMMEYPGFSILETNEESVCAFVRELLVAADRLKPGFFSAKKNLTIRSDLQFDTRWGLGSSSSLISNLAWWVDIDPYELFWEISTGSGYDIASARAQGPLIYQLVNSQPLIDPISFDPPYKENIFFVYLGYKQDSQYSVEKFREKIKPDPGVVNMISGISGAFSSR